MNEQEWLASTNPSAMLEFLLLEPGNNARRPLVSVTSDRKFRLFKCACARRVWHRLTDDVMCARCNGTGEIPNQPGEKGQPWGCSDCNCSGRIKRSRKAVEVAEQYADGEATDTELAVAHRGADAARQAAHGVSNPAWCAAYLAWEASSLSGRIPLTEVASLALLTEEIPRVALLRDVVGNPFRPVTREPNVADVVAKLYSAGSVSFSVGDYDLTQDMLTPVVLGVAKKAYEFRREDGTLDPEILLVLSDALEEAGCPEEVCGECGGTGVCRRDDGTTIMQGPCGCTNGVVYRRIPHPLLAHLRGQETVPTGSNLVTGGRKYPIRVQVENIHVRGCWAVDLILGKE